MGVYTATTVVVYLVAGYVVVVTGYIDTVTTIVVGSGVDNFVVAKGGYTIAVTVGDGDIVNSGIPSWINNTIVI